MVYKELYLCINKPYKYFLYVIKSFDKYSLVADGGGKWRLTFMSYYLQIGEKRGAEQIASVKGYGDLIKWVEALPNDKYPAICHLIWYGWEDDIPGLIKQFDEALKSNAPTKGYVLDTVKGIQELLKAADDAKVVTITDGFTEDDGMEDEE